MTATIYNIILEQGVDWFAGGALYQPDNDGEPDLTQPINLAGYTAHMVGRPRKLGKPDPDVKLFEITQVDGADGRITIGSAGTFEVRIKAARTVLLVAPAKIYYDLVFTRPDGVIYRIWEGQAVVTPGVATL